MKTAFFESRKKTAKKQQTYIKTSVLYNAFVDNLVDNLSNTVSLGCSRLAC